MKRMLKLLLLTLLFLVATSGVVNGATNLQVEVYLGDADFTVVGEENGDWTAYFASPAGDVNGDGLADFIVGAPMAGNKICPYPDPEDCPGLPKGEGRAYLVLGKPQSEWPESPMNLANADASFLGCEINSMTARQLYTAGDVNGDGLDDMLISGWKCGDMYEGKAYLVLGRSDADWGWDFDLDTMADASFMGEHEWDFASYYTATAGDVNGDGLDDMLVSVTHNDESAFDAGQVYLILGRSAADWGRDFSLANADASFLGEAAEDRIGRAVVGVGDINNDGLDDFMIGSVSSDDGALDAGETYLFLGRETSGWSMDMPVSSADASFVGEGEGDESGRRMAGVGDVNGDGFDDFLIGASKNDDAGIDAGKTYLFLGKSDVDWGEDCSLAVADAIFLGEERRDQSGRRVSGVGDPNHDGYDDFLIGAPHNSRTGESAGAAYLIYGRPEADWGTTFSLSDADVAYLGKPEIGSAGYDVAWVGDFDGDSIDDFLIAAYGGRNNDTVPGEAYLILGNDLPQIEMVAPLEGDTLDPMSTIAFSAWASDGTDGDLTSQIVWTSDLDGIIGYGGELDAFLNPGTHVIIASATDSGGFTVRAQVTIEVFLDTSPELEIVRPADHVTVAFGAPTRFTGEAIDLENGNISNHIVWRSSLDGQFGAGANFTTTALSVGLHQITASVVDTGGNSASETIWLTVNENQAPLLLAFDAEFDAGYPGLWYKYLALFGDVNGVEDLQKTQIFFAAYPGDIYSLNVRYLPDLNQMYLHASSGDTWLGPCTPGDDVVLTNGVVDVDCQLSTPVIMGEDAIKVRLIVRWKSGITASVHYGVWMSAVDYQGNSSGFAQLGEWLLYP